MGLFARLFGTFTNAAQGVKMKILLIGLDNSGKTTILNVLKPGKTQLNTVPTVGCATEQFAKAGIQFTAVDMSGQSKYRSLWEQYYEDTEAVIFVVDACDRLRFAVAQDELEIMLSSAHMQNKPVPLLVFANKMDMPGAAPPLEVMKALKLEGIRDKPWNIL